MSHLRPILSEREPKTREERHGAEERDGHDDVGSFGVYLENGLEIEERVELAGVPDNALSGGGAEERNQHALEVVPFCEGVFQRLGRSHARAFDLSEDRRFLHLQANVERDGDQDDGDEEGNAPAPGREVVFGQELAA